MKRSKAMSNTAKLLTRNENKVITILMFSEMKEATGILTQSLKVIALNITQEHPLRKSAIARLATSMLVVVLNFLY